MVRFLFKLIAWLALVGFSWLIVENSLPYLSANNRISFLEERPWLAANTIWRATLGMHVAGGIVCILSSLLQFHRPLLRRLPSLHRYLGRAYTISVIGILCPTGFYLSFFAKGGAAGVAGFLLLGVLTFGTTLRGWLCMRRGQTRDHIIWMIRSFAMITTAITFRIYNIGLYELGMDEDAIYNVALYLSLAGNAAVAEGLILRMKLRFHSERTSKTQTSNDTHNEKQIPDRVLTPVQLRHSYRRAGG